ncbi:hypothetical protein ACFQ9X_57190 [Catenulispora yoronensis]
MPWDIQDREYYPPQAAVIDLAVRIALAVLDEGRDVEDITADENAELVQALVPIVQVAAASPSTRWRRAQTTAPRRSWRRRGPAWTDGARPSCWTRPAGPLPGAPRCSPAPTPRPPPSRPGNSLMTWSNAETGPSRGAKCAVDATAAHETKPGEGRVQTRVCAH